MSEEEQAFLRELALEARYRLAASDFKGAWATCTDNLDQEEQMALWSLFESHERSAINKGKP